MSSSTTGPDPDPAAGAPMGGNVTAPIMGIPISEHAAHLSQLHIGVTSVLMLLCLITFTTRIYQRVRPVWKVGLDDGFIVAGFVSIPLGPTTPTTRRAV